MQEKMEKWLSEVFALRVSVRPVRIGGVEARSDLWRVRGMVAPFVFVTPRRQGVLPFLGIALRVDSVALTRKCLGAAAQEVLLARVRGWQEGVITDRTVEQLAGCSRASAFRALGELTAFGLIERIGYGYRFVPDVVQRRRLHMPRLRNSPIRNALVGAVLL